MTKELEREIARLKRGDHVCPIHDSEAERMAVTIPFIKTGLAQGECCFHVAHEMPREELLQTLAAADIDVIGEQKRGALRILAKEEAYLWSGAFDSKAILDFLSKAEATALTSGFSGFRFMGEMTWALESKIIGDRLIEYEALLNRFMKSSHSIVFCQYNRQRFAPPFIHDILRTHPKAIVGNLLRSNPYYEPPEIILDSEKTTTLEFKTKRVDWWISHLKSAAPDYLHQDSDETKLREKDNLIQLLLDSTAEAIYSMDLDGNCTLSNPVCTRLLGYTSPDELTGKNMHAMIHHTKADGTAYPGESCSIERTLREGKECHVVGDCFWRKDGTPFDVEYWSYPIRRDGVMVGVVVTFFDITERLKNEDQLRQSQKMESIGQLAGGVAHDFNNLLTVITGYSELLLQTMSPLDPSRKRVEEIKKAGERSASLTRQLLAFSRKQVLASKVLNLNSVVKDTESLLQRVIGEDINLTSVLHSRLDHIKGDSGQLEQVLLNLAVNARDAMPQGGKLTIETANLELGRDYLKIHADMRPGPYVMLSVTDSGAGMSPEVQKRIFEPYYTTKELGKGTGLGLAMVHGVVKQSEGYIEVYSEPGLGTSFKIYLPRAEASAPEVEALPGLEDAPQGTETLLLVEDEEAVRALISTVLQESGYTVLEAGSSEAALRIVDNYAGRIHMLVTDVVMPGECGRVLAEKLVAQYPKMKVLYLSGYTDDSVIRHGILQEKVDFLQKPFSPLVLAKKVREILSRPLAAVALETAAVARVKAPAE
jgi:PAS domain S-box-containing protein